MKTESDGVTVTVSYTGQFASKVLWNYGDGVWTEKTTHKYANTGYFTVECKAINNIAERVVSQLAEIGIVERTYLTLDELTDYVCYFGDTMVLQIKKESTDILSISGPAAEWLTVSGDIIYGKPGKLGTFELTITLTHSDAATSSGTIKVFVLEQEKSGFAIFDHALIIIAGVMLLLIIIVLFSGGSSKKR